MKRHYYFKKSFLILIGILVVSTVSSYGAEESITVTTYYPSPYGVYSEMRLYPKDSPTACDNNQRGLMYYDATANQLRICTGTPPYQSLSGYWAASPSNSANIYNTNLGNVGIGTTSPQAKLHVVAPGVDGIMLQGGIGWGDSGWPKVSSALSADQGGLMELGAIGPSVDSRWYSINPISGGTPYIDMHYGNGLAQDYNVRIINSGNNMLSLATISNGNVLTVNGGNVGIGTTGPWKKLDVQGGSIRTGGRIGTQNFDPDSGYPGGWGGGLHTWDVYAEGSVGCGYSGVLNAYMNRNGSAYFASNVGIGTTGPWKKLDVQGGSILTGGRIGTQNFDPDSGYPGGWGGGLHTWDVYAEGSVGCGYSGVLNAYMNRNGSAYFASTLKVGSGLFISGQRPNFFLALQGDRNMVLYDNGIAVWNSGTWVSDIRLKKDIQPMGKTLDKIKGFNAVKFILTNDESNTPQLGLIAQEIEQVFPELVYTDKNSGYKLIYYDKLSAILLQAVKDLDKETADALKEQRNILEEQKKMIESLKKEVDVLKNRRN